MLFSRISIEDNFDPVAIYKFYDLLSAEFSDMEIIWKSGIKNVSYGGDANSVKIKVNGKTLFIHNSTNNKGIISLANANGKVEFVLKAFEKAGFSVSEPDPGNSYIFLAIYTLLIGAVCTLGLNVIWLILLFVACLVLGLVLYMSSLKGFINSEFGLANVGSALILIGMLGTVPSSLLTVSFVRHLSGKNLYEMMANINQE